MKTIHITYNLLASTFHSFLYIYSCVVLKELRSIAKNVFHLVLSYEYPIDFRKFVKHIGLKFVEFSHVYSVI